MGTAEIVDTAVGDSKDCPKIEKLSERIILQRLRTETDYVPLSVVLWGYYICCKTLFFHNKSNNIIDHLLERK